VVAQTTSWTGGDLPCRKVSVADCPNNHNQSVFFAGPM
jgi:hypothetical protein